MRILTVTTAISMCLIFSFLMAQPRETGNDNFAGLYRQGKYEESLAAVNRKLDAIYETRVEDKRVPTEFITLKTTEEDIDLKEIFRNRKAKGFFIEDNPRLVELHVHAARCCEQLSRHDDAINNYTQALRFKLPEYRKDDAIYYGMSRVYKKMGHFNGYIRALETAYTLNPEKYSYSLELGRSLSSTVKKKKAVYHLERYISNATGDVPPELYLLAGNLHEDLGHYLETESYYQKYLSVKKDSGEIHFALGYIACSRTGNHSLAVSSFGRALELLPKDDIYRRSKCHEYTADMALHDLQYRKAIENYRETITYQDRVASQIEAAEKKIKDMTERINRIKTDLLNRQDYQQFEEYEYLQDEKGKLQLELNRRKHQYEILNGGAVRWNMAYAHERLEEYPQAIDFYRKAISFDYRANDAREKIVKLQLKIKRGY